MQNSNLKIVDYIFSSIFLLFAFAFTQGLRSEIIFSSQTSILTLEGTDAQLVLDAPINNFNGTLKITDKTATSVTQTSTANKITFVDGILTISENPFTGNECKFHGTYDAPGEDEIILDGDSHLDVLFGEILAKVKVSGVGSRIIGEPLFAQAIDLADASTELNLGITSPLTADINLNGGKVLLIKDLEIKDGVHLNGNGTVDVNGFSLILPDVDSVNWSGDISWENAASVTVREKKTLNGNWSFNGNNKKSFIRGWGTVLDISGGGNINVGSNHDLYISNLVIRGLGASGGGLNLQSTSRVFLSNVTLELSGSFTHDAGEIIVEGDNCKVVASDSEQFIITGSGTDLKIDGFILRYDALGGLASNPFTTASGGTITKVNNGNILTSFVPGTGGSTTFTGTTPNSDVSIELTSESALTFENDTPVTPKATTFNGKGNKFRFTDSASTPLVVEENVTLTLENTTIENFDYSQVDLKGSGGTKGKLKFGEGTSIEIAKNIDLTEPLDFVGNGRFNGAGLKLNLNGNGKLNVSGGKTLELKNVKLTANNYDSIKIQGAGSKIKMQSMELKMTETGLTIDDGDIEIVDDVKIGGDDPTGAEGGSQFQFTSSGSFQIKSGATLKVDKGATFKYDPDISGDGGDPNVEKAHLTFEDPTSTLVLSNSTLDSGLSGLKITHGKVFVDGFSSGKISTTAGKELEIGSAVKFRIMPAATFNVNGPVKMITSTFP